MMMPDKKLGVVVGQNKDNSLPDTIALGVIALLLGYKPEEVVPNVRVNKLLKPVLGRYLSHQNGNEIAVQLKAGALHLQFKTGEGSSDSLCLEVIDLENLYFKLPSVFTPSTTIKFHVGENSLETFFQIDRSIYNWIGRI